MPSSQTALTQIILDSPLSQTTKDFFSKKVKKEGATEENILALRELLRAIKHQVAADMGVQVDPKDPAVVVAQAKMQADLKTASDKYSKTMQRLEDQATRLTSDIQNDFKQLEKIVAGQPE